MFERKFKLRENTSAWTHMLMRTHVLAQTQVHARLFCSPTFLVHPLQAESEVPPPTRHGDGKGLDEEEDEGVMTMMMEKRSDEDEADPVRWRW